MGVDGLRKSDVGFILKSPFMKEVEKLDYFRDNALDTPEEEQAILTGFMRFLKQAHKIAKNEEQADCSEVIVNLDNLYKSALREYENLGHLSGPKLLRSVIVDYFTLNQSSKVSLDRNNLQESIKTNFLDAIAMLRRKVRKKELLSKRNWEKHDIGDKNLREAWLNKWLDSLQEKAKDNPQIADQLEEIAMFADERVNLIHQNGATVAFLDWDREFVQNLNEDGRSEVAPHPAVELLLADERINSVMVEYFAPELKANFRGANLPEKLRQHPIIQGLLKLIKHHAIGFVDGSNKAKKDAYRRRLFGFDAISKLCSKYYKDVLVGDIADSFQYMIARDLSDQLIKYAGLSGMIFGFSRFIMVGNPFTMFRDLAVGGSSLGFLLALVVKHSFFLEKGTRALKPNLIDKFSLHLEDARRIFLADAVSLATQLQSVDGSAKQDTTLVIYPPHHNNRIMENLQKPQPAKKKYYKTVYPYLNYSLRRYSHKPENHDEQSARIYSGWTKLASEPL